MGFANLHLQQTNKQKHNKEMKSKIIKIVLSITMMVSLTMICPIPIDDWLRGILGKKINKPEPQQPAPFVIIDEAR